MPPTRHRPARTRQRGAALMVMLVVMVMGIAVVLMSSLSAAKLKNTRQENTAAALAQAKDALVGYAVTYRDNDHPNEVFGYLPLPDLGTSRNNNGSPQEGTAAANFSGNTKNLTVIGKLPWRKLGLPPLRDDRGECLWYAVSGSFQNNTKADVLNWDSLGHFDAYSSDGTPSGTVSTAGANHAQRPVAIIFSAGALLQGQDRRASTTDTVSTCGGNYDARNYLDPFNTDANVNGIVNYFVGSTNNATGYAYNLTASSDGSQLDAAALSAPKGVIFGDIEAGGATIINDKMLAITADDIFRIIRQRADFATDINSMVGDLAGCLNAMPHVSLPPASGDKGIGGPLGNATVNTCLGGDTKKMNIRDNWRENLLYAKPGSPITVNGSTCNAVLIFGGARSGTQVRFTASDKADAANYLEGSNAASFPNGTIYSGATTYNKTGPSNDIVACITGT